MKEYSELIDRVYKVILHLVGEDPDDVKEAVQTLHRLIFRALNLRYQTSERPAKSNNTYDVTCLNRWKTYHMLIKQHSSFFPLLVCNSNIYTCTYLSLKARFRIIQNCSA